GGALVVEDRGAARGAVDDRAGARGGRRREVVELRREPEQVRVLVVGVEDDQPLLAGRRVGRAGVRAAVAVVVTASRDPREQASYADRTIPIGRRLSARRRHAARWISSPTRRASSSRSSRAIHGIDTRARSSPLGSANRR